MHARVWQLRILPGKTEEFRTSVAAVSGLAQKQHGYRGVIVLGDGSVDSGAATLIALWESLEAVRDSERNLFLTQAIARLIGCSDGMPHIVEQPVLATDFRAPGK
jgi:hypothetical protein